MSSDNEITRMKSSKPPPPVPPRPSKILIKEALAKTREAHDICFTRASEAKNHEKPSSREQLQPPETNKVLFSRPSQKRAENFNTRPIIYQSKNCKSPLADLKDPKTSEIAINGTKTIKSNGIMNKLTIPEGLCDRKVTEAKNTPENKKKWNRFEDNTSNTSTDTEKTDPHMLYENIGYRNHENDIDARTALDDEVTSNTTNSRGSPDCIKNNKHCDDMLNNRNHVNTLIDEMFASVLEVNLSNSTSPRSSTESITKDSDNKVTISNLNSSDNKSSSEDENPTVIVVSETSKDKFVTEPSVPKAKERKVKFNDRHNHEYLINELQNMKNQEEKYPESSPLDSNDNMVFHDSNKIQMNDWYGLNQGKKVKMSSCYIKIDDPSEDTEYIGYHKIKNRPRDYGLPPLPKSLSGFMLMDMNLVSNRRDSVRDNKRSPLDLQETTNDQISNNEGTNLDRQLAVLRREMDKLREQDLFLLSKLWFLNDAIQDFRQMLQDNEDKSNLTLSPSPTPSSVDDEEFYVISTSTC